MREERRLKVCENWVFRRIFGPKRNEVTWGCRKLPNEELKDVHLTQYYSGNKIEKNEMDGACNAYGEGERRIEGFGGET